MSRLVINNRALNDRREFLRKLAGTPLVSHAEHVPAIKA